MCCLSVKKPLHFSAAMLYLYHIVSGGGAPLRCPAPKEVCFMEELLHILERNARMPIEDIAAMMDKTPAEVAAMMDDAAARGLIRGYETLVDWERAGINQVEAVIELRVTPHKARGFDDIGMTIAQFDEVDTVLLMSGSYDLQVIIKGRSFQEIAIFVAKRLSPLDDVISTATSFVLRPYKRSGRLYLEEEPDERECTVL